jgi:uncharacterized protein YbaR (Trm112 family)
MPLEFPREIHDAELAASGDSTPVAVLAREGNFMLRPEVLATLCCPEDRSSLSLVSDSLITEINTVIREGRLRNRAGQVVEDPLDGGLTRASGDILYPILDGIPVLVRDEAIPLNQLGHQLDDE